MLLFSIFACSLQISEASAPSAAAVHLECIHALAQCGRYDDALVVCDHVLGCVSKCTQWHSHQTALSGGQLVVMHHRAHATSGLRQDFSSAGQRKKSRASLNSQSVLTDVPGQACEAKAVEAAAWLLRAHVLHSLERNGEVVPCLKQ